MLQGTNRMNEKEIPAFKKIISVMLSFFETKQAKREQEEQKVKQNTHEGSDSETKAVGSNPSDV